MKLIHAVFVHGIFRPTELVELPDGCEVDFEPRISNRRNTPSSNDFSSRLGELRQLNDGWLDGKGFAPNRDGLDWLAKSFDAIYPKDLPPPFVYPTAEGGVQLEWTLGQNDVSLDVVFSSHQGQWHCLNLKTQADSIRDLNLDHLDDWRWLTKELQRLAGGQP